MRSLEPIVREILQQLDSYQIEYLVPRNYNGLPAQVSNDLDVLVSIRHLRRLTAIVSGALKATGVSSTINPMRANGISIMADLNPTGAPGIRSHLSIHAQTWIAFEVSPVQKAVPGLSDKVFFEDVRRQRIILDGCPVWVPDPVDEFLLLCRQWRFKPKQAYLERLTELQRVAAVADFLRGVTHVESSDVLTDLTKGDAGILKRLLDERWGKRSPRAVAEMYARAVTGLLQARGWTPAPSIYLTGPDGAGKTTMARMIKEELELRGVWCRHFYSMKKNLLRDLALKIGRLWQSDRPVRKHDTRQFHWLLSEDITDRDDGTRLWRLRKFLRLCVGIVDIGLCYAATLVYRWRGYLLIIETSPYDLFVKYHMPRFGWLERLVCPLIPRPRLGLMMRADPETIHKRKTELTAAEIENYYRRMDEIIRVGGVSDQFRDVPTGDGPEAARTAMRAVLIEAL